MVLMMKLNEISDNDFKLFEQFKMFIESTINPASQTTSLHADLKAAGVEYAIIGGIALRPHNYVRATEDIDILVSKSSFNNLKKLLGRGYTLRVGSEKNMYMHIANTRLPIDVLVEGQQENGFSIPSPLDFRIRMNGVWFASLSGLIHLKLIASRERDLSDIRMLIEENYLDINFANQLPVETRERFRKLF